MFFMYFMWPVAVSYSGPGCNYSFDSLTISSFQKGKFEISDEEINHMKGQVNLSFL